MLDLPATITTSGCTRFKVHLPYHESDHVLNIAYNALCDARCLQDLWNCDGRTKPTSTHLGAPRIPDPTTAGDFCIAALRRDHLDALQEAIDFTRRKVWANQPGNLFFEQAILDGDGTMVETDGECKAGNGHFLERPVGIPPAGDQLLANTGEVLRLVNRSGNPPVSRGRSRQV